jgi:colanic acid/amylovoran biosynthesis glycosyltransferase
MGQTFTAGQANGDFPMKPGVMIFRVELLRSSETFILSQARSLREFCPCFVGWRRVGGLELNGLACVVANGGGKLSRLSEHRFRYLGPSAKMLNTLRARGPKLIHAHFGLDGCAALPLASRLELPLITTFHGFDATASDSSILKLKRLGSHYIRQRDELKRKGARFIAVSRFIEQRLLHQGYPPDRVQLHYIGVDTELFIPLMNVKRSRTVLFTGRLVEKKGCQYLIKAMASLQQELPDVDLVIIGDGPERSALEREARDSLKRYSFLGLQPPHVVLSWMQRSSIFCVPSITAQSGDAEGFGIVFAEAQACGTPVASFDSGGISDAVSHGLTGLLSVEKDWRSLADHLTLMLKEPNLWEMLSKNGHERVKRMFNLTTQTEKLERIYSEVSEESSYYPKKMGAQV